LLPSFLLLVSISGFSQKNFAQEDLGTKLANLLHTVGEGVAIVQKITEKGFLTPDNGVVALIDHQGQMPFGTSNFDRQESSTTPWHSEKLQGCSMYLRF
jgi:hypothetical protein